MVASTSTGIGSCLLVLDPPACNGTCAARVQGARRRRLAHAPALGENGAVVVGDSSQVICLLS